MRISVKSAKTGDRRKNCIPQSNEGNVTQLIQAMWAFFFTYLQLYSVRRTLEIKIQIMTSINLAKSAGAGTVP